MDCGSHLDQFDRSALDQLTRIYARVDQSIKSIEAELVAIAQLISAFSSQPANRPYLVGGLLLGGGAKVVVDNSTAGSTISNTAKKMQEAGTKAEAQLAGAAATALGFIFRVANDGSLFGVQIADDLQKAVNALSAGLRKADRELGESGGQAGRCAEEARRPVEDRRASRACSGRRLSDGPAIARCEDQRAEHDRQRRPGQARCRGGQARAIRRHSARCGGRRTFAMAPAAAQTYKGCRTSCGRSWNSKSSRRTGCSRNWRKATRICSACARARSRRSPGFCCCRRRRSTH